MGNLSAEERIDVAFTISHYPDERIQAVLNKCLYNVSPMAVHARAFFLRHCQSDLSDTNFVHDVIRLCLGDDQGEDATDEQVEKEIVDRAINIGKQISELVTSIPPQRRTSNHFLFDAPLSEREYVRQRIVQDLQHRSASTVQKTPQHYQVHYVVLNNDTEDGAKVMEDFEHLRSKS